MQFINNLAAANSWTTL